MTPLFADQPQNGRCVAAVGAGLVVEPHDEGAIRSGVDAGALHDAIAAEIRELPPVDEALGVLDTVP